MTLEPEAIDLEGLPRAIGGGLKREPVEELLRRVQSEYSQLYYEHKRLKEELERRKAEPEPRQEVSAPAPESTSAPEPHTAVVGPAPHRDIDDLARVVLASTHRASRELRESARQDCELMLKKVRARIARLETEFERNKAERVAELAKANATLLQVREQMKLTLEALVPAPSDHAAGNGRLADEDVEAGSPRHHGDAPLEGAAEARPERPVDAPAPDPPGRTGLEAASHSPSPTPLERVRE
jgi:cell division septum initiation protein DivIVA